jgi:hypothetical protein
MNNRIKLSALALLAAAATTANAETNLLQEVSVNFVYYSQGPTNVTSAGTNYIVNGPYRFGSKDLIAAVSSTGYSSGDVLVRATPVITVPVYVTSLSPVGTNVLVITNTSTSEDAISNEWIFNGGAPVYIGDTNVTYGTNIQTIGGSNVTIGTNIATAGGSTQIVGTNTTVTTTVLTNGVGNPVGTSNVFVSNDLETNSTSTNTLGTASWLIYNKNGNPKTNALSTNVYFDIHTDLVYGLTNVDAYVHGETITKQHVIKHGTTDEIRTLILSNSTWNIKLQGFAQGRSVPVNLGGSDVAYSQDYNWAGNGSGTSNSTPVVIDGNVSEDYFKYLK